MGCTHSQHLPEPGGSPRLRLRQPLEGKHDGSIKTEQLSDNEGPELELRRLQVVHEVRAVDTPTEAKFNTITTLLQGIFKVPIAVVGLIESDYLDLVSGEESAGGRTCARLHSFCDASLKLPRPTMMIVPDTHQDARFQHAELVEGPPYVRFYAGAPLVSSEGCILGSLGIMDLVPRSFPADMYNMVCNLAELVVRELERDRTEVLAKKQALALAQRQDSLVRALSCFQEAIVLCDLSDAAGWKILYANDAWEKVTGLGQESSLEAPLWQLLDPLDHKQQQQPARASQEVQAAIARGEPFSLRLAPRSGSRKGAALQLLFRPATGDHLSEHAPLIGIPGLVDGLVKEGEEGGHPAAHHYFAVVQEAGPRTPNPTSPRGPLSLQSYGSGSLSTRLSSHSSVNGSGGAAGGRGSGSGGSICSAHPFGLESPDTLKDLKLGPLLGKGSYGRVYRGLWHGAQVAVKVLDSWEEPDSDSDALGSPLGATAGVIGAAAAGMGGAAAPAAHARDALLEPLLSRSLPHPHIVQTYDFAMRTEEALDRGSSSDSIPFIDENEEPAGPEEAGGAELAAKRPKRMQRLWIIQQLCNRGTLYEAVDRGWLRTKRDLDGATDLAAVLQTAQEVASAMSFLHARDIVHGDLTGNNVLLSSSTKDARRFTAQVGDFGLARVLSVDTPAETGCIGTVSHMPPETLKDGTVDKATDVYSFGVLLWELYCHRRAWGGIRATQIVYRVATQGQKLALPAGAPQPYKTLFDACLADAPGARPRFDEILLTLGKMLSELRQPAPAPAAGGAASKAGAVPASLTGHAVVVGPTSVTAAPPPASAFAPAAAAGHAVVGVEGSSMDRACRAFVAAAAAASAPGEEGGQCGTVATTAAG